MGYQNILIFKNFSKIIRKEQEESSTQISSTE